MSRKKIVFIIVEGTSDQEALGAVLSNLYPLDQIYLHIVQVISPQHVMLPPIRSLPKSEIW